MKSMILMGALLVSSFAMAESSTYQVKGMHCGACAKSIEEKVCKMEGVKTCKVEMVDAKKRMGKVTLETEEGKTLDAKKVEELVTSAGDFTVVNSKK